MLLSDLVNKSRSTDTLFSKVYRRADNDNEYKRGLTRYMRATCKLPDPDAAIEWLFNIMTTNANLKKDIDALKEEFRAHRIASLTNASVGIVGAANFWNPVGIGLMISSGISELTNSITEICVSKRKNVDRAILRLQNEMKEPFRSVSPDLANFIRGYHGLTYYMLKVVGDDDVHEVLNVIFGCMYLLGCHENPRNVDKVWDMWRICHNDSKVTINSGLEYIINDCSRFREYFVGNNILFGAGVSVISLCRLSPTIFGNMVNSINKTVGLSITIPQNVLNGMRTLSVISKAAVGATVVLSVYTLVNDSIEVHNIDEKYKPFYDFVEEISKIMNDMKVIPGALRDHICSVQKYSLLCKRIEENAVD